MIRQSKLTGELAFDSEGSIPEKAKDVPAEKLYVRGDGYVTFIVTVTNIPDTRLDDVLTARSYIRLEDGTVLYGNALSRSVDGVRAAAARVATLRAATLPAAILRTCLCRSRFSRASS